MDYSEINILKALTGNEYKVYRYLVLTAGERKQIHGIEREHIEKDCSLGYTTVYQCLKTLKKNGLIHYDGAKKFVKILPLD